MNENKAPYKKCCFGFNRVESQRCAAVKTSNFSHRQKACFDTAEKLLTELTDEGLIHYLLLRYLRISTAQAAKIIAPLIT